MKHIQEIILRRGGLTRLFTFMAAFAYVVFAGCQKEQKEFATFSGETMGTNYSIKLGEEYPLQYETIDSLLTVVNKVFSTYDPTSYITAFNRGTLDEWTTGKDPELVEAYQRHFVLVSGLSVGIYNRTNGAFDPSGAALFNMWGFGEQDGRSPSDSAIDSVLKHRGMEKISSQEGGIIKSDSLLTLNFNAIAKGYGVDVIAEYLLGKGVRNFMIEIGGEVRAHGNNPGGARWVIGVNQPSASSSLNSVLDTLQLSNCAVATSGNYRNFYQDSLGRMIGHTIDPRTGYPVLNELKSCSILHPSCAIADAYATAAMVAGREELLKWIEADPLIRALIVVERNGEMTNERLGY